MEKLRKIHLQCTIHRIFEINIDNNNDGFSTEWAFPEKICTPLCWGYHFFEVDPLDFQSISWWLPGIFYFFALTSLELLVFPSNFDIPTWNFNYLYSTAMKFPLISSTGGFQCFWKTHFAISSNLPQNSLFYFIYLKKCCKLNKY